MERYVVKERRTEHAKTMRRIYGDRSGRLRFRDKEMYADYSNISVTITTLDKEHLIIVIQ